MLMRVTIGTVGVEGFLQVSVVGVQLQCLHLVSILQMLAKLGGGTAHCSERGEQCLRGHALHETLQCPGGLVRAQAAWRSP